MTKTYLAAAALAALFSTAALAQTNSGSDASGGSEQGGEDANKGVNAPWPSDVGNALFDEGFSSLRPMDDAKSRWSALSPADQEIVRTDCKRFHDNGMSGQTAAIESAVEPLSVDSMTAVCTFVGGL